MADAFDNNAGPPGLRVATSPVPDPGATPAQEAERAETSTQARCFEQTPPHDCVLVGPHAMHLAANGERWDVLRAQTADRPADSTERAAGGAPLAEDAAICLRLRHLACEDKWSNMRGDALLFEDAADALSERSAQVRAVQALERHPMQFPSRHLVPITPNDTVLAVTAYDLERALALNRGEPEANTDQGAKEEEQWR